MMSYVPSPVILHRIMKGEGMAQQFSDIKVRCTESKAHDKAAMLSHHAKAAMSSMIVLLV